MLTASEGSSIPGGVFAMVVLVSLTDVASRTSQPVRRLGRWCATGQFHCDREGGQWVIPRARPDLGRHVARRLGLAPSDVSRSPMTIDGQDYVVVAWRASTSARLKTLIELAEELGAILSPAA